MKREDVKNKIPGITEEQLNWLMQENGSDITREKFLSTLSLRRATCVCDNGAPDVVISIHTLLAESDAARRTTTNWLIYFYPHSPCGERRPCAQSLATRFRFLSTLSLRRATQRTRSAARATFTFLSTLSLRRATTVPSRSSRRSKFLSTLSLRRATA